MKKKFFLLLIIFIAGIYTNSFCQVYSESSLYQNGIKDYNNNDWLYASIYLFALIQRNPDAFATDPSFQKEVVTAFDYSMSQLRVQVANSKSYVAQQQQPQTPGLGSTQSGLEYKPPLRPANSVNLKQY